MYENIGQSAFPLALYIVAAILVQFNVYQGDNLFLVCLYSAGDEVQYYEYLSLFSKEI